MILYGPLYFCILTVVTIQQPPHYGLLRLLGTRQINANLAVARYIHSQRCICRMHHGRLVVNSHSAESAVGSQNL